MKRLMKIDQNSKTREMLIGCDVVTANSKPIGKVSDLLIDKTTKQLRFIGVGKAFIPWSALFFDGGYRRLVFYTCAEAA